MAPIKVLNITKHPKYKHNEPYDDIAVLKLERNATTPWICLWNQYKLNEVMVTAVGYGKEFFGNWLVVCDITMVLLDISKPW